MNIEQARFNMIEQQIRPWEVLDPKVLKLVAEVPREKYVPAQYQNLAFADTRIPIGDGQEMMEPRLEARILQALDIQHGDRVLEIGTGSGYLTACLATLADSVVSVEVHENLSKQAEHQLAENDIVNISLRVEDAMSDDWAADGSFDVIVVTGSLPKMDNRFHDSLNIDGRLFMVVGESPVMEAMLIARLGENEWSSESLFETDLAPLVHAKAPASFLL
ncbi:MAG: protein-L-isoaspartate O-methyltransferase [Gammaproteobacteria bacterium]|nr:MAG: protein-L-isoaspartate O-methyltransferase [Gammaproteobacteria bacterium]